MKKYLAGILLMVMILFFTNPAVAQFEVFTDKLKENLDNIKGRIEKLEKYEEYHTTKQLNDTSSGLKSVLKFVQDFDSSHFNEVSSVEMARDMKQFVSRYKCDSPILKRFSENLYRYSHGKLPFEQQED